MIRKKRSSSVGSSASGRAPLLTMLAGAQRKGQHRSRSKSPAPRRQGHQRSRSKSPAPRRQGHHRSRSRSPAKIRALPNQQVVHAQIENRAGVRNGSGRRTGDAGNTDQIQVIETVTVPSGQFEISQTGQDEPITKVQVEDLIQKHGLENAKAHLICLNYPKDIISEILDSVTRKVKFGSEEVSNVTESKAKFDTSDLIRVKGEVLTLIQTDVSAGSKDEAIQMLTAVMNEIKRKRREYGMITDHLVKISPDQEVILKCDQGRFRKWIEEELMKMDEIRQQLGAEDNFTIYSSISDASDSPLYDMEMKLAKARAELDMSEEQTNLEEEELELEAQRKKLELRKKELQKRTAVKVLESQVDAEKSSMAGSQVSLGYGYNFSDMNPKGPAEMQIPLDIYGRPVPPSTTTKQVLFSEKLAGMLGSERNSKSGLGNPSFGRKEERLVARVEDGKWPKSHVSYMPTQGIESQMDQSANNNHMATQGVKNQMDPTARHLLRHELMQPRADVFKGNKSKFWSWLKRINKECDELGLSESDRISVLRAQTVEEPRDIVDLVAETSDAQSGEALKRIIKELVDRFGSGPQMAQEIRDKVEALSPIKGPDISKNLQQLADMTTQITFVMKSVPELIDFNTSYGLKAIRSKLPFDLQRRWATAGTQYEERYGVHPPFSYFSEWINSQAKIVCHPRYRIEALSTPKGSSQKDSKSQKETKTSKVLKTDKEDSKEQKQVKTSDDNRNTWKKNDDQSGKAAESGKKDKDEPDPDSLPCFLHQGKHSLAKCFVFQKVKPKIKKELIADALVEANKNSQKDNPSGKTGP